MRSKRKDRPVEKKLSLPTSVVSRVEEQLRDPLTQRAPHGAWARLITLLLIGWLRGDFVVTLKRKKKPRPFCPECLEDAEAGRCINTQCKEYGNEIDSPTEIQAGPEEGSAAG